VAAADVQYAYFKLLSSENLQNIIGQSLKLEKKTPNENP
jgi:hypothetical protein